MVNRQVTLSTSQYGYVLSHHGVSQAPCILAIWHTNRNNEQENNEDLENNEETSSGNDGHALIPFP